MIAKNYRIYRIFNNIFITRNIMTDAHLIRSVAIVISIDVVRYIYTYPKDLN